MRQEIYLIFSFLLLFDPTQAATNIGGVYLQNTVWTASGSANPYYLISDVQIPRNVTLTIQQGVQIDFRYGDFEIFVQGIIKIQGTAAQPVIFKNGSINDLKYMINIQRASLSNSSIDFAQFKGPKKALQTTSAAVNLQQNTGVLLVQSSKFTNNTQIGTNGNYPRNNYASVPWIELHSCSLNQAKVSNSVAESESILIINSTVYNSLFYPQTAYEGVQIINSDVRNITIFYVDIPGNIQLINSHLVNGTVILQARSFPGIKFTVIESVIYNMSFDNTNDYDYGSVFLIFQNSTMFNTSLIQFPYAYGGPAWNISIDGCTFTLGNLTLVANSKSSVSMRNSRLDKVNISVNYQYNTYDSYQADSLTMRNTVFTSGTVNINTGSVYVIYSVVTLVQPPMAMGPNSRISCSSIIRASFIAQTNTTGINASSLIVDYSTIKNFATAMQIAAPNINTVTITDTNFLGISDVLIDNIGPYNVLAFHDYWGTNNTGIINKKIIDYWDNIHYGEVIYTNYSSNALAAENGCPPYNDAWATTTRSPYWGK